MKYLLALLVLLLSLLATLPALASPDTVYIIMSPFYQPQDRKSISDILVDLVVTAPLGTRLIVVDGYARQTIAVMSLPQTLVMANSIPSRKKAVRVGLAHILQWLERSASAPVPPVLAGSGIIDLPGALEFVSAVPSAHPEAIFVIASPLFNSLTEPQFSFLPDRFPADAHLFGDKGSTIFSILDKRQRLHNRKVFLWYPSERVFVSDVFRDRIERFWSLYMAYQQGVLAGFGADAHTILGGLFRADAPPVRQDGVDPAFNKIEMLSVRRPDPPHRTITNELSQVTFVAERAPTDLPRARERQSERFVLQDMRSLPAGKTAAGILWNIPGLDLDLYVWQSQGVQPLFYRNNRTPEGCFVHDYQDHNDELDYEKVILDVPPVSLESMKVAVNLFAGQTAQPVTGKVFIRHQGVTYAGTFSLAARQGNCGEQLQNHTGSPYWTDIDIAKLQPVGQDRAEPAH